MLAATVLAVVAGRALTSRVAPQILADIGAAAFAVVGVVTLIGALGEEGARRWPRLASFTPAASKVAISARSRAAASTTAGPGRRRCPRRGAGSRSRTGSSPRSSSTAVAPGSAERCPATQTGSTPGTSALGDEQGGVGDEPVDDDGHAGGGAADDEPGQGGDLEAAECGQRLQRAGGDRPGVAGQRPLDDRRLAGEPGVVDARCPAR